MALHGPVRKTAELRILEGERAHRPLPPPAVPRTAARTLERPKGMTGRARKVWALYVAQLAPMGVLRIVDSFGLQRLCEDVALLQDLQTGMRRLVSEKKREAQAAGTKLPGGALIDLAMTPEGRRLSSTINTVASRIKRDELQFGLTPVSSQRLENITVASPGLRDLDGVEPVEAALCG